MSDPTAVREWAKATGRDVSDRGRIRADVVAEYEAAHPSDPQDDGAADLDITLPAPDLPPTADDSPAPPKMRKPETPPRGRKKRWFEKTGTPGRPVRRVSLDSLMSWAWGLGGMALQQAPRSTPVGRMLALQAPVAGVVVDDLVRGTALDRVLQPLARGSEKAEKAFALLGPPVLVGMISNKPELYPVLHGPLKVAMLSWMELAPKAMEETIRKAGKQVDPQVVASIDGMIDALFADLPVVVPSEAEEEAVRRARANGAGGAP